MNARQRRIELEIDNIKIQEYAPASGWFASAHVIATNVDGRTSQGWVHIGRQGASMNIDSYDEYDDVDPGLLGFVVATEADAIIAAVKARVAESEMAA